ncbi:MAG: hypothetical protein VX000_14975, partial [Myxococcota bacterium]|nr:hypothetical protein [Myxococcota bacterium]
MTPALLPILLFTLRPAAADEIQPLGRLPDAVLDLPDKSRASVPDRIPVSGPWRIVATIDGVRTWEAPLPVRPRTLFFHKPVDDLAVFRADADGGSTKLRHEGDIAGWDELDSWSFSSRALRIRRAASEGPPGPGSYTVRYTRAVEREAAMNLSMSGASPKDFSFRSVQLDDTTRSGVLLPAPASATWTVSVPEGAVLDFDCILLPPEAADPAARSDGAGLTVTLVADGARTEVLSVAPRLAAFDRHRVDLSRWAGQAVSLELATQPRGDTLLDYVFVAEPVVHVPQERPPR